MVQEPQLDELYREVVLDHYRTPRGRCPVQRADVHSRGHNPVCGDELEVSVQMEGEKVRGVHVLGRGCSISTASGSMLAELLPGKTRKEARTILQTFRSMMHGEAYAKDVDLGDLEALEGVKRFPVRIKCAMLAWTTLEDGLNAWERGKKTAEAVTTTESEAEDVEP